jgi:peptide methionine sulfoxide reductase MsrB
MIDNPNYKNHLKPEQYEVCWNRGTEAPFFRKVS